MSNCMEKQTQAPEYAQHRTHLAYRVETRARETHPGGIVFLLGQAYGAVWMLFSVPEPWLPLNHARQVDRANQFLTRQEALAVAWRIMAHSWSFTEADGFGLEVRLVEYAIVYSYEATRTIEHEPLKESHHDRL